VTKFQDGTLVTIEGLGCQENAVVKATKPLFADPVTICPLQAFKIYVYNNGQLLLSRCRGRTCTRLHELCNQCRLNDGVLNPALFEGFFSTRTCTERLLCTTPETIL